MSLGRIHNGTSALNLQNPSWITEAATSDGKHTYFMDKVWYMDKRHVQNLKLYGIYTGPARSTFAVLVPYHAKWTQILPTGAPKRHHFQASFLYQYRALHKVRICTRTILEVSVAHKDHIASLAATVPHTFRGSSPHNFLTMNNNRAAVKYTSQCRAPRWMAKQASTFPLIAFIHSIRSNIPEERVFSLFSLNLSSALVGPHHPPAPILSLCQIPPLGSYCLIALRG